MGELGRGEKGERALPLAFLRLVGTGKGGGGAEGRRACGREGGREGGRDWSGTGLGCDSYGVVPEREKRERREEGKDGGVILHLDLYFRPPSALRRPAKPHRISEALFIPHSRGGTASLIIPNLYRSLWRSTVSPLFAAGVCPPVETDAGGPRRWSQCLFARVCCH